MLSAIDAVKPPGGAARARPDAVVACHHPSMPSLAEPVLQRSALVAWLASRGYEAVRFVGLPGDVSPRRYLRVELAGGGSVILACYPPAEHPVCRRFVETTGLLEEAGVPVPRLLATDCEAGLTLLEDAGEKTLYDRAAIGWQALAPYFESAIGYARSIAALPAERVAGLNPPLDEALLRRELDQTWELFLAPRGLTGGAGQEEALRGGLDELCRRLGAARRVPCHRDFMARNLVPGPPPRLTVLDHQDLRLGPAEYDLASLLNDSLFPPPALERRLLETALGASADLLDYHRAAAQRTLKAVGTFAAFARRGFDRHLRLVPPTLSRSLRHLSLLPETAHLAPELRTLWAAIC